MLGSHIFPVALRLNLSPLAEGRRVAGARGANRIAARKGGAAAAMPSQAARLLVLALVLCVSATAAQEVYFGEPLHGQSQQLVLWVQLCMCSAPSGKNRP